MFWLVIASCLTVGFACGFVSALLMTSLLEDKEY